MKHSNLYWLSLVATLLIATGCDEDNDTEPSPINPPASALKCQSDGAWKCYRNTLVKCVSGKWEITQTCQENTQCNAEKGLCEPNNETICTNDTWKCFGNTLTKCVSGKWEIDQTCQGNALCNAGTGSCEPSDEAECTNDTWKCDGNTLSKCVSGKWKIDQTCQGNALCNAESGTCIPIIPECMNTEHIFADQCEPDDVTHCGTHTNDCTQTPGWKNGSCADKSCFAEACESGYHLANHIDNDNLERTICEEDTHDACGSIHTKCDADETCTQGECQNMCQPGEVVCDGSCINPNTSKSFCGADTSCSSYIPCSEFEDCIDGKCILTSCQNEDESLCTDDEQNICVNTHGNNPNHCGDCGTVCSDLETARASGCNRGQCTYTCHDDMVNCGSDTDPMCLSQDQLMSDSLHCGKCDTKCAANEFCENGQCIISSCTGNECLLNHACVNQNDHCGTQCANCNTANHASAGVCQEGTCIITSCVTGYHLTNEGVCKIDSAAACPNGNATGTVNCNTLAYTVAGICEEGICKATKCQDNAHIKGNLCVADTIESCGSEDNDCTQLSGWKTGACKNGKCVAATCQSGFCLNTLQGLCTNVQSSTMCGIDGGVCQSCTIKQVCSAGACTAKQCEGNVCQQPTGAGEEDLCKNDNAHCGSECLNCSTFTNHATAGTCSTSGTCQVTACEANYHIYNNACEADSTTNCGTHNKHCNVANATNSCSGGECTFICNADYHTYNNACEADSTTNCGTHNKHCNVANATNACTNGMCTFACNEGYVKKDSICVPVGDAPFITVWNLTSNNQTIEFPFYQTAGDVTIDWGDGSTTDNVSASFETISHTYALKGNYTIKVYGELINWSCYVSNGCSNSICENLVEVQSYGNSTFGHYTFCSATKLVKLPTDSTPRFKDNKMIGTFDSAVNFNQNINFWDTSNITEMSNVFMRTTRFNQPLDNWDTSNVTSMYRMFKNAKGFNQSLNNWNTSNVTNMQEMFAYTNAFNQPLSGWDTSSVSNMDFMFQGAYQFNQPLNDWDTSNVMRMSHMFNQAASFNQPLDKWDVSNVMDMQDMFTISGLQEDNYCKLFTGAYSSVWTYHQDYLGLSYTCP